MAVALASGDKPVIEYSKKNNERSAIPIGRDVQNDWIELGTR